MKKKDIINLFPVFLIILGVLVFSITGFTISEKSITGSAINTEQILKMSDLAAAFWGLTISLTGILIIILKAFHKGIRSFQKK
ncbi:hypothetical protein GF386_06120 [Candidatus Pacearchaeota archaeon]|nr:hypothetical protein [Candidatus Pacearchaeota archaeon]MBD3283665.1 hypothetical protein [Candidatus Pacearchaeota archaeon]